jgi:hypothetical protein
VKPLNVTRPGEGVKLYQEIEIKVSANRSNINTSNKYRHDLPW